MNKQMGLLYVVATPIGNLQDITLRALEVLKQVDCIAAEDTRHARQLLNHFSIQKATISLHQFNEQTRMQTLLEKLQEGKSIALVSDAGTPLISDPGYVTVCWLRQQGIRIVPVPGASALIAALSVAGLPTDRFLFMGFLPNKSIARRRVFEELANEKATLVFYESTHRILDCLLDLQVCFPERTIALARELTKLFETIHLGTASELSLELQQSPEKQRGEFVILVEGKKNSEENLVNVSVDLDQLLRSLLHVMPLKQAVKAAVDITQLSKNTLYARALALSVNRQ